MMEEPFFVESNGQQFLRKCRTDGLRHKALADARRPEQEHVASLAEEAAGRQIADLFLGELGIVSPVKMVERLAFAELSELDAALDQAVAAHVEFILQDQLEELQMRELMTARFGQPDV